ncbi:MAG: putative outer membrane protein [Pseudomonas sp.]|nr:putative outer membrane protein [Pseudomonas sp.]
MKLSTHTLRATGLAVLLSMASAMAYAAAPAVFVDDASAKGLAEIQTSQLALEKSKSDDIQSFAKMMIDDHTAANKKLADIASALQVKMASETELMDRAKKMILQYREGSFDKAYVNNQVKAHEAAIKLFQDEAKTSQTPELTAFVKETLPKLQQHLDAAKQLQAKYNK